MKKLIISSILTAMGGVLAADISLAIKTTTAQDEAIQAMVASANAGKLAKDQVTTSAWTSNLMTNLLAQYLAPKAPPPVVITVSGGKRVSPVGGPPPMPKTTLADLGAQSPNGAETVNELAK